MKRSQFLFIFLMAAVACSKKEDSAPSLQNAIMTTTTAQAPSGLTTAANTNYYAHQVENYIGLANGMTSYTSYFKVPASGATKSSTTIKASNGRVASTASRTETYTWSDSQYGAAAFQITDDGTSYKWEFLYKTPGADWLKFLNAEEMKDGSSGHLEVLDFEGSDPKVVSLQLTWSKVGNQYTVQRTSPYDYFILKIDMSTNAGSIDYYFGSGASAVIRYKYSWGADGHGSWQSFDQTGTQDGGGTW